MAEQALSPWQRGILFADRLDPGGVAYNMGFTVRFCDGAIAPEELRDRCSALVAAHDELRARFDELGERRRIAAAEEPDYRFAASVDERTLDRHAGAEMGTPFDLAAGPPIRFRAFRLDDGSLVLLVVVHHAVFDDRSKDLLVEALCRPRAGAGAAGVRGRRPPPERPLRPRSPGARCRSSRSRPRRRSRACARRPATRSASSCRRGARARSRTRSAAARSRSISACSRRSCAATGTASPSSRSWPGRAARGRRRRSGAS